jgi:hypothetical protein
MLTTKYNARCRYKNMPTAFSPRLSSLYIHTRVVITSSRLMGRPFSVAYLIEETY